MRCSNLSDKWSHMPIPGVMSKNAAQRNSQAKTAATAQPQLPPAAPTPQAPFNGKAGSPANSLAVHRRQIPKMLLDFEPQPLKVRESNPLLKEDSAAVLLAVSQDLMKKWRQRNWGPNYIQYGKAGPVRYEFEALMDFRERHRVEVRSKK